MVICTNLKMVNQVLVKMNQINKENKSEALLAASSTVCVRARV